MIQLFVGNTKTLEVIYYKYKKIIWKKLVPDKSGTPQYKNKKLFLLQIAESGKGPMDYYQNIMKRGMDCSPNIVKWQEGLFTSSVTVGRLWSLQSFELLPRLAQAFILPKTKKIMVKARANRHVHWFLEGKGLGIQQGERVGVGSSKSMVECLWGDLHVVGRVAKIELLH